jgi:hypothetical protein
MTALALRFARNDGFWGIASRGMTGLWSVASPASMIRQLFEPVYFGERFF